jgi:hypothetical protein
MLGVVFRMSCVSSLGRSFFTGFALCFRKLEEAISKVKD